MTVISCIGSPGWAKRGACRVAVRKRLGVIGHGAAGHLYHLVLAVLAEAAVLRAAFAVSGQYVALILQVQQRPIVAVAAQDDVAAPSAVAAVGSALGHVLGTVHVCGTQ